MKNTPWFIPVLGFVAALTACSSPTTSQGGSGGKGSGGSGGVASSQGGSSAGGSTGTAGQGGKTAAGGSGGAAGSGGSSASGGTTSKPGSGGSSAAGGNSGPDGGNGGHPGTGGSGPLGGTTSQPGTGGSGPLGGTTSHPGTGGAVGGNAGRDAGPGTGGAGGGTPIDGGGSNPSGQSAGCGKTSTITSSQYNNGKPISITVNGAQRRYILSVPTTYSNTTAYKFVLALHQWDGNDIETYKENYYGLQSLSKDTTIFAAPNGVNTNNNNTPCTGTGSGESKCGWPSGYNNMELMDAVVKQVTDNFCVDTNRIFATGWSYGASMSYEIACERPLGGPATTATWGVRAVATYSVAQLSGSCKPSSSYPVAYYLSHGTHDSVLGYSGGITLAQNWSNADGCTWQTPTEVTSGTHVCTKMAGCKSGYPVEVCSFNGDHTPWPDNQSPNDGKSWGPPEAWSFLSQF